VWELGQIGAGGSELTTQKNLEQAMSGVWTRSERGAERPQALAWHSPRCLPAQATFALPDSSDSSQPREMHLYRVPGLKKTGLIQKGEWGAKMPLKAAEVNLWKRSEVS